MHELFSCISEIKVTRLGWCREHGRLAIAWDFSDDQELVTWRDDDFKTHLSYSCASDCDYWERKDVLIRKDSQAKWVAAMAKACVYFKSINEFCGGYMGMIFAGTRFARLLSFDNTIIIECTPGMVSALGHPYSLRGFLDTRTGSSTCRGTSPSRVLTAGR